MAELDRIVRNGEVRPNAAVFTQRIMYHGLRRDIEAAEGELDVMMGSGVPPDAQVFNALLRQCLDYAPKRFGNVLAAMDAAGLAWDDFTFAMVAEHRARARAVPRVRRCTHPRVRFLPPTPSPRSRFRDSPQTRLHLSRTRRTCPRRAWRT